MMSVRRYIVGFLLLLSLSGSFAQQCGSQAGGALCSGGLCCSQWGWCGNDESYCGPGCQSQCGGEGSNITAIITEAIFDEMLMHRNDWICPSKGFYTYDSFVSAASTFPDFGTTGDLEDRKRELAAFFAQTSHETTAWTLAPGRPFSWGYCYVTEQYPWLADDYCHRDSYYQCASGKKYYGRGPFQLKWNDNYGQCGDELGVDLLNHPELLEKDSVISFKSAIWFWMTHQPLKPSCHDVITGQWTPTQDDRSDGRLPGYGAVTNIINGHKECGKGKNPVVENRIGFYKRYCDMLGVDYGDNLDCYHQEPFGYDFETSGKSLSITSM